MGSTSGFPEALFELLTGCQVAVYDVTVWEGTDLENVDCEVTIEWTVSERAVCDDEGLIAGLFGTLPCVWKQIFNLWRTLEAPMMLTLHRRTVCWRVGCTAVWGVRKFRFSGLWTMWEKNVSWTVCWIIGWTVFAVKIQGCMPGCLQSCGMFFVMRSLVKFFQKDGNVLWSLRKLF